VTRIINNLDEISHNYDALFVDLWGCVHNGISAYASAVNALVEYRRNGGKVVLVTNSPKPRIGVEKQLLNFNVPKICYDTVATSGDSARTAMFEGAVGKKIFFIGEPRDQGFFEPISIIKSPIEIEQVSIQNAEGIVCTGPFDGSADPSINKENFLFAIKNDMKFLCANPDIVVDRGEIRQWCAGALAKMYTDMGGESLYFGKPHKAIYNLARIRLAQLGAKINDNKILAIGDGVNTDIKGANSEKIDSLFVTGGLAAKETKTNYNPNPEALKKYITEQKVDCTYSIGYLR
tara:strand:- start:341 stop:1213 length:873 start_codon:yes stop_codon:yes gene_type:complete